ncbi:hypothetical protein [Allorhodopirellula heiligendammensis]|uniref:SMP-30/Gluconolaconase/LRE-like region n=1 Tax=Allorhodopirellula heiligendammensis TaxID=2714739 RepID=A0A5C6C472_9BACT|nr:hypothetical protein [Allorhodopirellula heiligendammensis]TWU18892.1 hypothetical protein Poly21_10630 [Allorhodopirellula heiligendammensis]
MILKNWVAASFAILGLALVNTSQAADPTAETILKGLQNPSCVSFSEAGELTVCDSRGSVMVLPLGELPDQTPIDYVRKFDTEFWKSDDTGKKWYGVGPLSAVWIGKTLVVTDAGKLDGEETLLMFTAPGEASSGVATNSVGPTTDDEADKGEGNLTGLSVSEDGKQVFVCGQGYDGKSWVLVADPATKKLEPLLSADDNGIETNSPMQTVVGPDNTLYVLYSGKGGEADGLIVQWDLETKKPVAQWKLADLINPMGMAHIEGNKFAVVENNWALTSVNDGRVVTVELGDDGEVDVTESGITLKGPVSCAFGPDNRLYVTQLGENFDAADGSVVAIKGLK